MMRAPLRRVILAPGPFDRGREGRLRRRGARSGSSRWQDFVSENE